MHLLRQKLSSLPGQLHRAASGRRWLVCCPLGATAAKGVEGQVGEGQEGHSGVSVRMQFRHNRELETSC